MSGKILAPKSLLPEEALFAGQPCSLNGFWARTYGRFATLRHKCNFRRRLGFVCRSLRVTVNPGEAIIMSRETTLKRILECGIVAVVRSRDERAARGVVQALADGGVTAIEITFTVPDAIDVIRQVRRSSATRSPWAPGPCSTRRQPAPRLSGRGRVHRGADRQSRRHSPLPPVRQGRHARGLHANRSAHGLGSRRRHREDLPCRRRRPGLSQSAPRTTSANSPDADRRRRPDHGRGVPEAGACCLGVGGSLVEPKADRRRRLRPDSRPCEPVLRDRSAIPGGTLEKTEGWWVALLLTHSA